MIIFLVYIFLCLILSFPNLLVEKLLLDNTLNIHLYAAIADQVSMLIILDQCRDGHGSGINGNLPPLASIRGRFGKGLVGFRVGMGFCTLT